MTHRLFVDAALAAAGTVLAVTACGCSTTVTSGLAAAEPTTVAPATGDETPSGAEPLSIGTGATDSWSGYLPDGMTLSPFDTSSQVLALLDPLLLKAIQDAARSAQSQGIDITITSGWRSKGFQQRLFDDAVRRYGSVEVAGQFVASPDVSRHVVGEAIDIAGEGASAWLIRNGPRFGLCQIYANENWHFELAADGEGRCPPLRPNAAG
ncbi:M15 family metallopeptidase [Mycobacterium sp. URHB0044]|uniref:M15 family metallopeptidase n=1 Tax=Mycobacterium sp. URHB0044 TaxID=1380386 RepID=UPI000B20AC22|nr:M15 family metallopeptidase [Mycobacterium sp. URHB0044]